jgi:hypothetical protein
MRTPSDFSDSTARATAIPAAVRLDRFSFIWYLVLQLTYEINGKCIYYYKSILMLAHGLKCLICTLTPCIIVDDLGLCEIYLVASFFEIIKTWFMCRFGEG